MGKNSGNPDPVCEKLYGVCVCMGGKSRGLLPVHKQCHTITCSLHQHTLALWAKIYLILNIGISMKSAIIVCVEKKES